MLTEDEVARYNYLRKAIAEDSKKIRELEFEIYRMKFIIAELDKKRTQENS